MSKILVRIETSEMKKALDVCGSVIQSKNALPILGDIVLRYQKERGLFQMLASNSEQFICLDCTKTVDDGEGCEPWLMMIEQDRKEPFTDVAIPHAALREAIATLPTMPVTATIDTEKQLITVQYGKGQFSMPVEQAAEFPVMPAVVRKGEQTGDGGASPVVRLTMEGDALVQQILRANVCTASDELRPQMGCVCLDIRQDRMVYVSSDGYSLYKQTDDKGLGYLEYGEFPVDGSTVVLIVPQMFRAMKQAFVGAKAVTLTADSQRVEFSADGLQLVSRTLDQRYPNYESVIPKQNPHTLQLDRMELVAALRRVQVFANDASNMVVLARDGESLVLSASDYDFSRSADERITIVNGQETSLPDGFKIGCKISTMLSLLQVIVTDTVLIDLADADHAFLLRPDDPNAGLTLLQMPMVVNNA